MNQTPSTLPDWISEAHHPLEPMRIVTLYDTRPNFMWAEQMVAALANAAGSLMRIKHASWNFNMLTRLDVRHASAAVAAEADILAVAADESALLQSHVKSWIEEFLRNNTKSLPVVVGLYASSTECEDTLPAFRSELLSAVKRRRMAPLFNTDFDPLLAWQRWEFGGRRGSPSSRFNYQSLPASPGFRRGGINE